MDGHGCFSTSSPEASWPESTGISSPEVASSSAGTQPLTGVIAAPGLCGPAPLAMVGAICTTPVSVCHQVSATGQRSSPTTSRYHRQASGLIGSPTLPSNLSDARDVALTGSSPDRINARIAVGAVYRCVTLCSSTTPHNRPASGYDGTPSKITCVAPLSNGP